MKEGMRFHIERVGDAAMLYLTGDLQNRQDVASLSELCFSLPMTVRTLRLDLSSMARVGADAMEAIGVLLCEWRESRSGEFRLYFHAPRHSAPAGLDFRQMNDAVTMLCSFSPNEALTAMYL
jgi:ABC-type transporter Mla MlaB component